MLSSVSYEPLVDNVQSTSMEAGAPKRRRRFTAVPDKLTCTVRCTQANVATLRTFVETTLQDVLPFDWVDFRTGLACTYVFTKRPGFALVPNSGMGARYWDAALELQVKL